MSLTVGGKWIASSRRHPLHMLAGTSTSVSGRWINVSPTQLAKAEAPIVRIDGGRSIRLRLAQRANADGPILVSAAGNRKFRSRADDAAKPNGMRVTPSPMLRRLNPGQLLTAFWPTRVTLSLMLSDTSSGDRASPNAPMAVTESGTLSDRMDTLRRSHVLMAPPDEKLRMAVTESGMNPWV